MQSRSVEFAKKFGVRFEVRSSLNQQPGTIVREETMSMESVVIRGISLERDQAKITIEGVRDKPGTASKVFAAMAENGRIYVRDVVMAPSRTDPPGGALFAVNMLVCTAGGGTYTFDELGEALRAAGFAQPELLRSDELMGSIVVATKPGPTQCRTGR